MAIKIDRISAMEDADPTIVQSVKDKNERGCEMRVGKDLDNYLRSKKLHARFRYGK